MKLLWNRIISLIILLACFANMSFCVTATELTEKSFSASDYSEKNEKLSISNNIANPVAGEWLNYDISDLSEGRYILIVKAKTDTDAFINIAVNGEAVASVNLVGCKEYIDNFTYIDIRPSDIIPNADNRLKISCAFGNPLIESLYLKKISGTQIDEKNFISALNASCKEEEIISAFTTYGEKFSLDLSNYADEFWYKKPIYTSFINRDFKNVSQVAEFLSRVVADEKASLTATLYEDDVKVTELSKGIHNLKIEIKHPKIQQGTVVLAALYQRINESDKMIGITGTVEVTATHLLEGLIFAIDDVTITNPEDISWKLFCFEKSENIKPYDIYINTAYRELYVSADGDDNADGSEAHPFKTIKAAKERASSISDKMTGDIIINIAPGDYYIAETERFSAEHSGKNGYNIIYKGSNPDNPPVIHGGIKVENWHKGDNGVYWAAFASDTNIRNLYIDGIAAERSRTDWCYEYFEDYDDPKTTEYTQDGFVVLAEGFPQLEHPEEAEMVWELAWECHRIPVRGISDVGTDKLVTFDPRYFRRGSGDIKIQQGCSFFLENSKELVNNPGEFAYSLAEQKIYYYPYNTEELNKTYVAKTEGLISVNGSSKEEKVKNLVFDNIAFKYGAWNYVNTYGLIGVQADSMFSFPTGQEIIMLSQFDMNMAENIKIINCEFSSLGSAAIGMKDGVANVLFQGNVIKDTSGSGMIIGTFKHADDTITADRENCRNIDVDNNVFRRVATEYRQNCVINVYYENDISITHNDISGTPYSAISAGWGWETYSSRSKVCKNLNISYNRITDVMCTLDDGAHIYTLGYNSEGTINNNYLEKTHSKAGPGIYLDAGSSRMNVYNNLVLDNDMYFLRVQSAYLTKYNRIYDNYSDTVRYSLTAGDTEVDESNYVESAHSVSKASLPDEAQTIYDNAGLTANYKNLLVKVQAPSYIRDYISNTPKTGYYLGDVIQAEDFVQKTDAGVTVYPTLTGLYGVGEVKYSYNAPEAGIYKIIVCGCAVSCDEAGVTVRANGKSIKGTLVKTSSSSDMYRLEIGELALSEGNNDIKIRLSTQDSALAIHMNYFIIQPVL